MIIYKIADLFIQHIVYTSRLVDAIVLTVNDLIHSLPKDDM